jgi:hypothetical protein
MQTLAGLCSSPVGSPTLLATPEQFKIFVLGSQCGEESDEPSTHRVFPYPSGYDTMLTGAQFLDALSICLLCGMPLPENPPEAALDGSRVGQLHRPMPALIKAPAPGGTENSL